MFHSGFAAKFGAPHAEKGAKVGKELHCEVLRTLKKAQKSVRIFASNNEKGAKVGKDFDRARIL